MEKMTLKFNRLMKRHEVYGPNSVIRNGERQPVYVSQNLQKARDYIWRCGINK